VSTDPLSAVLVNGRVARMRCEAGRIGALEPVAGPARAVALPLPVEPHAHLDKTGIVDRCGRPAPGLFGAIEAAAADKVNWTEADLRARAGAALDQAWENGVAALRTHVDWDGPEPPLAWRVIGELAAEWAGRIEVQRAALGTLDLMGDADAGPRIAAEVARTGGILGAFVYRNEGLAEKLADLAVGVGVPARRILGEHVRADIVQHRAQPLELRAHCLELVAFVRHRCSEASLYPIVHVPKISPITPVTAPVHTRALAAPGVHYCRPLAQPRFPDLVHRPVTLHETGNGAVIRQQRIGRETATLCAWRRGSLCAGRSAFGRPPRW